MTADQVFAAAKASEMIVQRVTVQNNAGETGVMIRDKTAARNEATQTAMVKARVTGGVGAGTRSGLKMVAWISASTPTVMEIEARNAGVDSSESDSGGLLYQIAIKKWGSPSGQSGTMAPASATGHPAAAYWGDPNGIHAAWHGVALGDNELLDDLGDDQAHRYELDIVDPAADKASEESSHPASAPPKL